MIGWDSTGYSDNNKNNNATQPVKKTHTAKRNIHVDERNFGTLSIPDTVYIFAQSVRQRDGNASVQQGPVGVGAVHSTALFHQRCVPVGVRRALGVASPGDCRDACG